MIPLVRLELTYYTPLFERADFTKFVRKGIYLNALQNFSHSNSNRLPIEMEL